MRCTLYKKGKYSFVFTRKILCEILKDKLEMHICKHLSTEMKNYAMHVLISHKLLYYLLLWFDIYQKSNILVPNIYFRIPGSYSTLQSNIIKVKFHTQRNLHVTDEENTHL